MGRRGRPRHPDVLTPREWEVLGLIRDGLSNEEIAARLGISIDGAKYHVSEILGKLNLENRHDAARWSATEARPSWAGALLFWRRPGWLSPAVGASVAVAVAAGIGLLVWGLLATRDDGSVARNDANEALPSGRLAYIRVSGAAGDLSTQPAGDLWIMSEDGANRRLTNSGDARSPVWSPDGTQLILFRGTDLWLIDGNGQLHEIERGVSSASWSPESNRIAFVTETEFTLADGRTGTSSSGPVLIYHVANGEREALLPDGFDVGSPAWSPAGKEIAFARSIQPEFGPTPTPGGTGKYDLNVTLSPDSTLWIVDADGNGAPRRVVSREELLAALPERWQQQSLSVTSVANVDWSPDGDWIVFRTVTLAASAQSDGLPLLSIRPDGSDLTYHGLMLGSPAFRDWSPDGKTLAITLGAGRDVTLGKTIALVTPGVAGGRVIAEEPARYETAQPSATPVSARSDAAPSWSPDGTRIAFQASDAGVQNNLGVGKLEGPAEGIWIVNADGSGLRQLTSDPNYLDFLPRWSADGDSILFVRTSNESVGTPGAPLPSDNAEVWTMRADGTQARSLSSDLIRIGSYYGLFHWDEYVAWYRGS